ncbi:MAG: hypothetical protein HYZ14_01340 [Bacteroidetes bacterium]|nr:hypothetical protein [Bacteroidota bacterium]
MKKSGLLVILLITAAFTISSCKKSQPSYKMEGTFLGHFQGNYQGNDTIVNENYSVVVEAIDKSTATVSGTLFSTFNVLVAKNGINVELVSPTDGLTEFLYEGDTETLTFSYTSGGNTANYVGTKN